MYRTRKTHKTYNPDKSEKQLRSGRKACPFCDFTDDNMVRSGTHFFIVKNIFPYQFWEFMTVTDHLMIVPNRHVESLHELDKVERIELMDLIGEYQEKGYNVYAREAANTSKSVPHQHTHLIKTDNRRAKFFLYVHKPYLLFRR
jgi:diadenosine tetraphosphate (Ap4A) HIT family hydrolase